MDIRNDIKVDHEHTILSNYAIYETSIAFRSGKIDNVIKSAMELNSSYILNAPALSLEGGDSLDMTRAHISLHSLIEECHPVKLSLHIIEEIKCPVVEELIKKFDENYYDKSLNLITNGVHKSTVSKKTLGYGDKCDKKNSVLNIQPNQKDDIQAVSNESPIRNKTNLFLRNENSFSDDKVVLENISSDTFNIYRKFPSSTSSPKVRELIKKFDKCFFDKSPSHTASPKVRELIKKFDKFFYDKSQNLITNGVRKSTVMKKTLGHRDQCDKKRPLLNI